MAEVDLTMAFNLTPSLLEQLGKALTELQSHSDTTSDTVTFTEISDHFRDLEQKMLQKYTDLESKQHSFNQQQSNHHQSLAEKLAAVTQKEQDMFDRIQLLKDASVAAISEACAAHLPPPVYTTADDVIDDMEVVPNSPGDDVDGGDESVTFFDELTRLCDEMDAKGLVSFFMENRKNVNVLREELSHVLKSNKEPGRLVLDSLQGFYPNTDTVTDTVIDTADSQAMRQSCIYIMEALNVMLEGGEMGADVLLGLEIKQQAKSMADEWKPKLVVHVHDHDHENVNVNDGKSLEAEAFLKLVGTFRIASEFDEDELCKLIFAVCERRHAPNLCRPLGLSHKMPGVVEELISSGKLISAVHFVHGFKLSDRFPTVPLLKTYLKDLRRSSQGKRGNWGNPDSGLNEGNTKELVALQNVVYCVQKYDLETEYPLEAIYRRVEQLERAKVDRKRSRDPPSNNNNNNRFRDSPTTHHYQNKKRPRGGGRSGDRGGGGGGYGHHHHRRHGAASNGRHVPAYMDRSLYAAQPGEQYPQVDHYSYPPAQAAAPPGTQAAYSQQVYEQSAYYYPPPDPAAAATPAAATYGVTYTSSGAPAAYQPTPYQPYYQ